MSSVRQIISSAIPPSQPAKNIRPRINMLQAAAYLMCKQCDHGYMKDPWIHMGTEMVKTGNLTSLVSMAEK